MEELQDAIEDVQYLQAVNSKDSGPSPTEAWPFPSEKALEEFNAERLKKDGKSSSLERICSGVLGLYLVSERARSRWSIVRSCAMCSNSRAQLIPWYFLLLHHRSLVRFAPG